MFDTVQPQPFAIMNKNNTTVPMIATNMVPSPPLSALLRRTGLAEEVGERRKVAPQCGQSLLVWLAEVINVGETGPSVSTVHAPTGFWEDTTMGTTFFWQL
jgi:hypothetical protein